LIYLVYTSVYDSILILSEKLQETLKAPCQMNIIKNKGILFVIVSVLSHCVPLITQYLVLFT
jgi:hypothetical protein